MAQKYYCPGCDETREGDGIENETYGMERWHVCAVCGRDFACVGLALRD